MAISETNTRTITPGWLSAMGQDAPDKKRASALQRFNWGQQFAPVVAPTVDPMADVSPSWDATTVATPTSELSDAAKERVSNSLYGGLSDALSGVGKTVGAYTGIATAMGKFSPSMALNVAKAALNPLSLGPELAKNTMAAALGLDPSSTLSQGIGFGTGVLGSVLGAPALGMFGGMLAPVAAEGIGKLTGTRQGEEAKQAIETLTGKNFLGAATAYADMNKALSDATAMGNLGSYASLSPAQEQAVSNAHALNIAKAQAALDPNRELARATDYEGITTGARLAGAYESPEVMSSMANLLGIGLGAAGMDGGGAISAGPASAQGMSNVGGHFGSTLGAVSADNAVSRTGIGAAPESGIDTVGFGMGLSGRVGSFSGLGETDREAAAASAIGSLGQSGFGLGGISSGGGGLGGMGTDGDSAASAAGASGDGSSAAGRSARGTGFGTGGIGRDSGLGGSSSSGTGNGGGTGGGDGGD